MDSQKILDEIQSIDFFLAEVKKAFYDQQLPALQPDSQNDVPTPAPAVIPAATAIFPIPDSTQCEKKSKMISLRHIRASGEDFIPLDTTPAIGKRSSTEPESATSKRYRAEPSVTSKRNIVKKVDHSKPATNQNYTRNPLHQMNLSRGYRSRRVEAPIPVSDDPIKITFDNLVKELRKFSLRYDRIRTLYKNVKYLGHLENIHDKETQIKFGNYIEQIFNIFLDILGDSVDINLTDIVETTTKLNRLMPNISQVLLKNTIDTVAILVIRDKSIYNANHVYHLASTFISMLNYFENFKPEKNVPVIRLMKEPCKSWLNGYCFHGNSCLFLHGNV